MTTEALDKVVSKIRKLLALAQSSNEHEAASAAAKAAELMEEHQLSEAALASAPDAAADEPVADHEFERSTRRVAWRGSVAHGVSKVVGCYMYWHGGRIMMIGRKGDADAGRYLHQMICAEIDRVCDQRWDQPGSHGWETARVWKNAFRVACADVVRGRLMAQHDAKLAEARARARGTAPGAVTLSGLQLPGPSAPDASLSRALVVLDKRAAAVEGNVKARKWHSAGSIGSTSSRGGREAGRAAGQSIGLGGGCSRWAGRGFGSAEGAVNGGAL